ncbi:MAG: DsrE family protein [Nitrospirota bacterium]|jgi:predicted peroxiredoxin
MAKIVYVISRDPFKDTENVSAVLAQALTALSFDYECEIFLMDEAVNIAKKGAINDTLKFATFEPINMMLENYLDMDGVLYVCHPSSDARGFHEKDAIEGAKFVNASKILESGKNADVVFTF